MSFMKSVEHIKADPQDASSNNEYPNSSNSLNRNCLTCVVTNPYPGLDVDTKLTIRARGVSASGPSSEVNISLPAVVSRHG